MARYWTRVKMVYGLCWLAICGLVFLRARSEGLLWSFAAVCHVRVMHEGQSEVLIVGAGPTGCAAGIMLARDGIDVCVVDRAEFPRDKTCGDAISNDGMVLLEQLGARARPWSADRMPLVRRAAAVFPDGTRIERDVRAAGLHRAALPPGRRAAQSARGIRRAARTGLQRVRARPQEERVVGAQGKNLRWSAELVIAADGYGSVGLPALGQDGPRGRYLGVSAPRITATCASPTAPTSRTTTSRTSCRTATAGSSPRSTASRTSACTCARTRTRARASSSRADGRLRGRARASASRRRAGGQAAQLVAADRASADTGERDGLCSWATPAASSIRSRAKASGRRCTPACSPARSAARRSRRAELSGALRERYAAACKAGDRCAEPQEGLRAARVERDRGAPAVPVAARARGLAVRLSTARARDDQELSAGFGGRG